jgi:hypothetical protein
MTTPANLFRHFKSSPEAIHLVVPSDHWRLVSGPADLTQPRIWTAPGDVPLDIENRRTGVALVDGYAAFDISSRPECLA